MLGVVINTVTILVSGTLGKFIFQGLFSRHSDALNKVLGIMVAFIGLRGALESENTIIMLLSLVTGCLIGELLGIETGMQKLGHKLESLKIFKGSSISKGFVAASIIFCSGSMAILGPMESGLTGNNEMLIIKSVLDGITIIILGASFGMGVILSAAPVFLYEGAFALAAGFLSAIMSEAAIQEMSATGNLLLVAIGINFMGTKLQIRAANLIPAIILPWPFLAIQDGISQLFQNIF